MDYDLDNCPRSAHALRNRISSSGNAGRVLSIQTDAVIIKVDVDNDDVEYRYDALARRVSSREVAANQVQIYNDNASGNQVATTQIDNHILWSTRRRDELTGYYTYKFRHYSAELGRWLARDPIEEKGGINLYGFVGNDPANYWDYLGLWDFSTMDWCDCLGYVARGAGEALWEIIESIWDIALNPIDTFNDMVDGLGILKDQLSEGELEQALKSLDWELWVLLFDKDNTSNDTFCKFLGKKIGELGVGVATGSYAGKLIGKLRKAKGSYGHLRDHPSVGPNKDFTAKRRADILAENKRKNGGVYKDDVTGEIGVSHPGGKKGVSIPDNAVEVDHVYPKSRGGTNSNGNANVRLRKHNNAKSDSIQVHPGHPIIGGATGGAIILGVENEVP